jgi:FkbM family methyltransferase
VTVTGRLAQLFFDRYARPRPATGLARAGLGALDRVRRSAVRRRDPLVRYDLAGTSILLPLSHDLPYHRVVHPGYADNLVRLVAHLDAHTGGLRIVDVGANVGDTVALFRSASDAPVLCIEGDDVFFPILERNATALQPVELERAYVAGDTTGAGRVERAGGTASLVPGERAGAEATFRSLREILDDHPAFRWAKLLKIDTDGHDAAIIRGAADHLRETRPVVFFEFDPYFMARTGDAEGPNVLAFLVRLGYQHALVYENTGDLLVSLDLGDDRLREDLIAYYTGRGGLRYCDVAAFPAEDGELFEIIRSAELWRRKAT